MSRNFLCLDCMYKTYVMSIIRYIEETSSLYPHEYQTNGSSLIFFGMDHVTNVQSKVTCRNDVQVRLCTCWGAPSAKGRQGADPGRDLGAAKAGRQDLSDQETRSAGRWRQGGGLRASQGVAGASRRVAAATATSSRRCARTGRHPDHAFSHGSPRKTFKWDQHPVY